jgi:nitronate monooxygenase
MEQLGMKCPIIQAPMAGGGDTVELVAAVSDAGGLGSIGAAYLTPEQIISAGKAIRERTRRAFGVNLFAPLEAPVVESDAVARAVERVSGYYEELGLPAPTPPMLAVGQFDEQLAACLETEAVVLSFTFGTLPAGAVAKIKNRGKFLIGTATTVQEAQVLVERGVDAVVAQGGEAGGHRASFAAGFEAGMVGTMTLVPQMVDAVPVPIVASGGIMDGRGIAAALALGASAVQMGTAFLTCPEAGVAEAYKESILAAGEEQTRITRAFSGRPARGIANRVLVEYENAQDCILPFPLQNSLTRAMRTQAGKVNRAEYLSLWAGQGVRMARRLSAADLVAALERETADVIEMLAPRA